MARVPQSVLKAAFAGKKVLVTGHTGFKGGWLALWLHELGADVTGIGLEPNPGPSLFTALGLQDLIDHRIGDIRSQESFSRAVEGVDADVVIHMAAQAVVRQSYDEPVDTYLTNVVGTAVVLEAARQMPSLKAVVVVTSDKCYENREWVWGYRENDPIGGVDPYSSSKSCAELVTSSYRHSFFRDPSCAQLATARAGNVFGGGDWNRDRLIPDIMKAALAGQPVVIRNPGSIRPWQHVLEPLSGYLLLAANVLERGADFAESWNFGPNPEGVIDVGTLATLVKEAWGGNDVNLELGSVGEDAPHEAGILRLDSTKATTRLAWRPRLDVAEAVAFTVDWYKAHAEGNADMLAITRAQIKDYEARMCG
jgi:CDP-glucose 4,6-dehydratase